MVSDAKEASGSERRRGTRIASTFLLQMLSFEQELLPRRGNISVSGVYFDTDQAAGEPGDVCPMRIAATEDGPVLRILARLVRVRHSPDRWDQQTVEGLAFEFLVHDEGTREQIREIVKQVAALRLQRQKELQVDYTIKPTTGGTETARQATVRHLSLEGMRMETGWPVKPGEDVRVAVTVPNAHRTIQLEGRAVSSAVAQEGGRQRFTTEVEFTGSFDEDPLAAAPGDSPETFGSSISDVVDQLLSEIIDAHADAPQPAPEQSLRGSLAQISLPSLLGFLQMERRSGRLEVVQDAESVTLFVSDGTVVDLEPAVEPSAVVARMAEIVTWQTGSFEFTFVSIERENRIGMSTQGLLLEVARILDERNR